LKTLIYLGFSVYRYLTSVFERPAIQRMIADAKAGRINLIIVKDLSRFGRNYIEIGQFTDYLFPSIGCRFIALGNGIDTQNQSASNDMMGFLNLFNEFYSRDTSKKVRAVRKACAEQGMFMGTYAPYGYKKDPADPHRLVIDEEYAPMARRIFDLRCRGMSFSGIARLLNDEGVTTPTDLFYQQRGTSNPRNVNHRWCATTVKQIIRSEIYVGNMVNGKCGTVSYKNKKIIQKDPEDWIRVEGTHEPLISMEVWATCLALDEAGFQKREQPDEKASILTGMVYCADCGFKMNIARGRHERKSGVVRYYNYFGCGSYRRSGKTACTPHSVREEILLDLVVTDIRKKARAAVFDEVGLRREILRLKSEESDSRLAGYERELKAARARLPQVERLMMNLYEDRISGTLPDAVFATLMRKYEMQQAELNAQIPALTEKTRQGRLDTGNTALWMKHIRQYTRLEALDEAALIELVERIEVGEPQVVDGKKVCDVKILYRYVGYIDEAMSGMEAMEYAKAA